MLLRVQSNQTQLEVRRLCEQSRRLMRDHQTIVDESRRALEKSWELLAKYGDSNLR